MCNFSTILKLLVFVIVVIVVFNVFNYIDYTFPSDRMSGGGPGDDKKKTVTYYINGDAAFQNEVREILGNTGWNDKFIINEVDDKSAAMVVINLTEREDMEKWREKGEKYPSGKEIRFSITTQGTKTKPAIFIDENNWLRGVPESGLNTKDYREYVINHEFGHALGFDHQDCAGLSEPNYDDVSGDKHFLCPVMYQMTRGVPKGGIPNSKVLESDYSKLLSFRYGGNI